MTTYFLGVFLLIFTFLISYLNAWSVGRSWAETKAGGAWAHIVSWSAAIMSACGFTWVYLFLLGLALFAFEILPLFYVEMMFQLGYVIIIFPVLGSGLALTLDSWAHFWRQRNVVNAGITGWNTYAQIYNTVQAARALPEIFEGIFDFALDLKGSGKRSKDSIYTGIIILAVVLSLVGGILTTAMIIRSTAAYRASELEIRLKYRK